MTTTFTAQVDDPGDFETTTSPTPADTSTSSHYMVTHVFFPVQLPRENDYTLKNDLSLVHAVCTAAHTYSAYVNGTSEPQWHRITKMLDNLQTSVQTEHLNEGHVISQLRGMQTGDILTFFIRRQNAAIVLTKRENHTLFESFEVSPSNDAIEATGGSLRCSYPWSAVETPNDVFVDENFQSELAGFLSRPSAADLDLPTLPPARPQYVTALLAGILRGVGHAADVPHFAKRVRDEAEDDWRHWRRSSLWHLIKVAIQMSVGRPPLEHVFYKRFMLFFMCILARDVDSANFSSDLLHLMSSKILRRLSKLGSSTPDWLSEMVVETCARLQESLDTRWKPLSARRSPFRNPSQDELIRDTKLSLLDSREYICNALAKNGHEPLSTSFHPIHRPRGTVDDFLSLNGTFFEEAHNADPDVTLYDVEQSVEQGIDDWFARITNVNEACAQIEILMDKYTIRASSRWNRNSENTSIMLLTATELFITLDKLAVKEIPMLAEYSPEIPIELLERLLLRKTTSLHRLSRAYQYLNMRQAQSRPGWSVLSDEFSEDSFAVRYYDQSRRLQDLKARIEGDMMVQTGHAGSVARTSDGYQEYQQSPFGRRPAEYTEVAQSPLPVSPLHVKVVVFELHCPLWIRIWRSAALRILHYVHDFFYPRENWGETEKEDNLLAHVPALRPYFVERDGPPLSFQIHFVYFYSTQSRNSPTLRYAFRHQHFEGRNLKEHLSIRRSKERYARYWRYQDKFVYKPVYCHSCQYLEKYVNSTSHTSNDILADQAHCPADLSLDEFVAFAHLRGGGLLQWVNILRGLRSRTLNFRLDYVHFLLTWAALQVGPLDSDTGTWVWHQELQDPSFCNALLAELDGLFVEVAVGSIDGVMMSTISLLLTRVLASSPSEAVSERAITLLRSVRKKTFSWVQELSYNLAIAPMKKERSNVLRDMAATCRSTFDVDLVTLPKLFRSAEDIDALLSCAFLIHALRPESIVGDHSLLVHERDHRLSHTLEGTLVDVILADASDCGIDLAVGKIFASHKPGAHKWTQLEYPNTRWLTCRTKATMDQKTQTVHVNLVDGAVRVDGQPLGGLPRTIRDSRECQIIFRDQGFFVIPSSLPGMDFTTLGVISKHQVHFSLRDDNLVVRAQCNETNDVLELIPSEKLLEDLPPVLVYRHVHWLNLSTKIIEIRPLERLWEGSSENWRIDCAPGRYRVYRDRETLVDTRSQTWAMVSQCFECLNNLETNDHSESLSKNLLITTFPVDSPQSEMVLRLSVTLPQYGLSFFVNEREDLESRDFKDMIYDENQCVGTLFGLENLLHQQKRQYLARSS